MTQVTVSTKYQVVIPLEVRRQVAVRPGERFTMLVKGGMITLIPRRPLSELRGSLKGMDTRGIREKRDRM